MLQEDLEKRLEEIEAKLEELENLHLDNKLKITEIMSKLNEIYSERKKFRNEEIPTKPEPVFSSKNEEKKDTFVKTIEPAVKEEKSENLPPPAKPELESKKHIDESPKMVWSPPKTFLKNRQPQEDNEIKKKIERIKEMIQKI